MPFQTEQLQSTRPLYSNLFTLCGPRRNDSLQLRREIMKLQPNQSLQMIKSKRPLAIEENARPQKYCFRNVTALAEILSERIATVFF